MNTLLGNIKTSLAGIYHAFGFQKYAHRYLGQVKYLFNRRFGLRTILQRLARAASQATPCPMRMVRAAESSVDQVSVKSWAKMLTLTISPSRLRIGCHCSTQMRFSPGLA